MKNKKRTGSYYTPKDIAEFLVEYVSEKIHGTEKVSILEPSAGDGVFLRAISNNKVLSKKVNQVVAIERDKTELKKIVGTHQLKCVEYVNADFLEFQKQDSQKFSIVLGNPPYVKKNLLTKRQVELCKEIHSAANLADHEPKNIWAAFLVRCIQYTKTNGVLAFILPAELLQVKFAKELRDLIVKEFARVEIFTFNELLFDDCQGQDTVLVVAERQSVNPGVYYCNVDKASDLTEKKFELTQNVSIKDSKWNHHHMEAAEIELLDRIKNKLKTIDHYCESKAGIVTAANDFFIVDESTVEEFSLTSFVRPIVQKGAFVNGSVILSSKEFKTLVTESKPAFLLSLTKDTKVSHHPLVQKYLRHGVDEKLNKRYKMKKRKKWYRVPNIGDPAEAFFFKRCDEYPKLIKNSAEVLVTDCAYKVEMNKGFEINDLIYSFYNSLTLCFAELSGRYYGGGVLELTPNEFKSLPVPYTKISNDDFNEFATRFKAKESIHEICLSNDLEVLSQAQLELDRETILKLAGIRQKLFLRRTKKS